MHHCLVCIWASRQRETRRCCDVKEAEAFGTTLGKEMKRTCWARKHEAWSNHSYSPETKIQDRKRSTWRQKLILDIEDLKIDENGKNNKTWEGKKENIHCKLGNDSTTPSQRSHAKNQLCGFLRDFYGFSMSFHGFLWISWMSMDCSWIFLWIFLWIVHGMDCSWISIDQTHIPRAPDPIRSLVSGPGNPLKIPALDWCGTWVGLVPKRGCSLRAIRSALPGRAHGPHGAKLEGSSGDVMRYIIPSGND